MSDAIQRIREALAWSARAFGDHSDDIRTLLDRLDAAERERDSKAAELANLQVAFSDWKVFHSTARLEAENERLRMELAHEEQRVADMMADVNRVGHENEALREDAERMKKEIEQCRQNQ